MRLSIEDWEETRWPRPSPTPMNCRSAPTSIRTTIGQPALGLGRVGRAFQPVIFVPQSNGKRPQISTSPQWEKMTGKKAGPTKPIQS